MRIEGDTMYIYPDNLKAAPTLWLWRLRDVAIGGLLAVPGVARRSSSPLPLCISF